MSNLPKLDKKFYGDIWKAKNDERVPDDEWCVFLAKDNAFVCAALPAYITWCETHGCDAEQMAAIKAMRNRIHDWRAANIERCKIPDAAGEKLLP